MSVKCDMSNGVVNNPHPALGTVHKGGKRGEGKEEDKGKSKDKGDSKGKGKGKGKTTKGNPTAKNIVALFGSRHVPGTN